MLRSARHFLTLLSFGAAVCWLLASAGCGRRETPASLEERLWGNIPQTDRDIIAKHLKNAGINGIVVKAEDEGERWFISVRKSPMTPSGVRPVPGPPASLYVDKKSGKVTQGFR